ncbi:MAG: hypothetical protein [Bacteriophage sp.]|nr:MAG: hypothetical protein [Bacteriophage sp.]
MIYNNFKLYNKVPVSDEEIALDSQLGGKSILFIKAECGTDWYSISDKLDKTSMKVVFDADGIIRGFDTDASMLFPIDLSFAVVSKFPKDLDTNGAWKYVDGKIVKFVCPVKLAEKNKAKQTKLLIEAVSHYVALQLIGEDITVSEREERVALRKYILEVKRTNFSQADVVWPDYPN